MAIFYKAYAVSYYKRDFDRLYLLMAQDLICVFVCLVEQQRKCSVLYKSEAKVGL